MPQRETFENKSRNCGRVRLNQTMGGVRGNVINDVRRTRPVRQSSQNMPEYFPQVGSLRTACIDSRRRSLACQWSNAFYVSAPSQRAFTIFKSRPPKDWVQTSIFKGPPLQLMKFGWHRGQFWNQFGTKMTQCWGHFWTLWHPWSPAGSFFLKIFFLCHPKPPSGAQPWPPVLPKGFQHRFS